MVTWTTPRPPLLPLRRTLAAALLVLGTAVLGCTSIDGPTADVDEWKATWADRAGRMADATSAGANKVGESFGVAVDGVKAGFEEPDPKGYGRYPKQYVATIRQHMIRWERTPEDANFQFGLPEKGFMNKGILAGGEIEWQGWLVDINVETTSFAGQKRTKTYVVRMRDGGVVEVHDAQYATALRRLEPDPAPPAKRAR